MPETRYVTRAELNGQILILIDQVTGIRSEVGEVYKVVREQNAQFCILLEREVDKREGCARDHGLSFASLNKRMGKIEKSAAVQDVKLRIPGWIWKAAVGAVLVAGSIVGILAAVHVI